MIDGIPIFDCVIHVYDMSDSNLRVDEPTAAHARDHITYLQVATKLLPENQQYEVQSRWTPESTYEVVFEKGGTDLAMAQTVPIFDWFEDWFAPVKAQYDMARRYPDEVLFCGGVDPIAQGLDGALDQIEVQVEEMGARSFKFYNGHIDESWRCDDPEVAYPMYEKIGELGVDVVQFHKGTPFGKQNLEDLSPLDLQKAARDFPDLKFVIHHAAIPYFMEAVSIASRFENVYIALSGNINAFFIAPRMVQEWVGTLLQQVGADRVLWGSESPLQGNPRPYLESFVRDFEIPAELTNGYGMPQITREDKEKILGGNFARLMGIDLPRPEAAGQATVA
jgi:predicted TIM-barrel fold metal-dependent hydrolase